MNEIKNAARLVAESDIAAGTAADALAAAHRHADGLRFRRTALAAERDTIAAARRAGGEIDGSRLAVIQLDVEGLDGLIADATAAVAAAQAKADAARTAAANARQQLDLVQNREMLARLTPHAAALAQKLADIMTEIRGIETRLRIDRPSWAPLKDFATEIRRLDLLADGAGR